VIGMLSGGFRLPAASHHQKVVRLIRIDTAFQIDRKEIDDDRRHAFLPTKGDRHGLGSDGRVGSDPTANDAADNLR